jgi:hypothetical protein
MVPGEDRIGQVIEALAAAPAFVALAVRLGVILRFYRPDATTYLSL